MADRTLDEFSKVMAALGVTVVEGAGELVRKVALAADQAVVVATPVDTGAARSNWLVSLNVPDSRVVPAYSRGAGGSTASANTQAALEQARQKAAGFRAGVGGAIVITNNLAYIDRLNSGWSAQAPAGFVERAVLTAAQAVTNFTIMRRGR